VGWPEAYDRPTSSTTPSEGGSTNVWNADGTLRSIERSNGTATRYDHDRAKRITGITHTHQGAVTLQFTYTYDRNGNRRAETRTQSAIAGLAGGTRTTTYTYDQDDRLIGTAVTSAAEPRRTRRDHDLDARRCGQDIDLDLDSSSIGSREFAQGPSTAPVTTNVPEQALGVVAWEMASGEVGVKASPSLNERINARRYTGDKYRDAKGRLHHLNGSFAQDGAARARQAVERSERSGHGNTAGDQNAYLYARYDADGNFLKYGITQDLNGRYTQGELAGGYLDPLKKWSRSRSAENRA
jgi:hypothetical protein